MEKHSSINAYLGGIVAVIGSTPYNLTLFSLVIARLPLIIGISLNQSLSNVVKKIQYYKLRCTITFLIRWI